MQPIAWLARGPDVDDSAMWAKHKEELIRYATMLVGPDHAEDVLSTVVERVLRRRGSLSSLPETFRIHSVALNDGVLVAALNSNEQPGGYLVSRRIDP